jgi:hypothetical protein
MKRHCPNQVQFDIYMHQWFGETHLESYQPVRTLYERYHIDKVPVVQLCKSLEEPERYDLFLLVRLDVEIADNLDVIDRIDPNAISEVTDRLQFFGRNSFAGYQSGLMPVAERKDLGNKAFFVRSLHKNIFFLDFIEDAAQDTAFVSLSNVYCRRKSEGEFVCKFQPKIQPQSYQWIAKSMTSEFVLNYSIWILNSELCLIPSLAEFMRPIILPNFWYKFDTLIRTGSSLIHLDSYLNSEELVFEVKDIRVKRR